MQKSRISKLSDLRPDSEFARRLGTAIREHRRARGLTQSALGSPFTKGYVSEVERGHSLPSLRALTFLDERLDVRVGDLLDGVKGGLPDVYTPSGEDEHPPTAAGH